MYRAAGLRGDLDPYRVEDMRELRRLLVAASLALANAVWLAYRCLTIDLTTMLAA